MLPDRNQLTVGHLLLAFGVLAGAVGLLLVVAPVLVPVQLRNSQPSVDGDGVFWLAAGLGGALVLTAVFRVLSESSTPVDRSPIADSEPEQSQETTVPTVGEHRATLYNQLLSGFDRAGRRRRYVAIYGRRATQAVRVPGPLRSMLDELAVTAADTYATATGCEVTDAQQAVDAGTWTDDRVAGAFLASDPDAAPTFTTRERLLAWIAPRYVFQHRLERSLDEIESVAGSFLTYNPDPATSDGDDGPDSLSAGGDDAGTASGSQASDGKTGADGSSEELWVGPGDTDAEGREGVHR